jgi:hypothetical protein
LAKTPFIHDNANQLKHGFTGIGSGTGTSFHTGEEDIFPGDKLYWSVIPRPVGGSMELAGGQFGDSGPGSRQGTPMVGTPRGKLRFRINPSRFNDMRPSLNAAVSAMRKPMAQGGCADRPYEHLFSDISLGAAQTKPTPIVEYAMALAVTDGVAGVRFVRTCQKMGIALDGVGEVELCERLGIFKVRGKFVFTRH